MNNQQTTATVSQTSAKPISPVDSGGVAGAIQSLAPIAIMLIAFYFLIIRPQSKRAEQRKRMIASCKKGDKIVTAGGIIATVHKIISETEMSIEISNDVRVRILTSSVTDVLAKDSKLGVDDVADEKQNVVAKKNVSAEKVATKTNKSSKK